MILPLSREQRPTVLLVEDDETTCFATTSLLVQEGYLVLTADTTHAALTHLKHPLSPIDVILLDVHLPDVSGTELCARIGERHPGVPVIVCTGEAEPDELDRLKELGVFHCFRKPVPMNELLIAMKAALGQKRRNGH